MKNVYGDHTTRKELITLGKDSKKAAAEWRKLQKEWMVKSEKISLESKDDKPFWFLLSPYLLSLITRASEERGFLEALSISQSQRKKIEEKTTNYEAYYSSHIEGAQSTLEEALKFIKKRQKLAPNESLQMIGNNKRALDYALKQLGKPISHELICKLQLILTENTHKSRPITMGEYRHGPVYIVNGLGQVIYEGPPAEKVPEMMDRFVEWISADDNMNPLIKVGIVHLYFVHVHPFDDGNGRTARALSNLVLTNLGFKFVNMLSLSSYFDHRRSSYYKAIQDVREHGYDLTYFLIFYLEALLSKLEDVKKEIEIGSKVKNIKEIVPQDLYHKLSRRQIKALRVMIRKNEEMTTRKYCKINKCSDETARKDFIDLVSLKIIEFFGKGRSRKYKLIV